MCGINLIIDKTQSLGSSPIKKMNGALAHRGPDHSAFHEINTQDERLFFGSTRLKIVDKTDYSNQPFVSERGQTLIYNGEIYNYHDLKNEMLAKGHSFQSNSDSETLFRYLIENGTNSIVNLNGMFAFVFYDGERNSLHIARDSRGMKPLFYFENDQYFIASSEIKGIFASGLVEKVLNEAQIDYYLRFKHAAKPATFFKGVFELEEGHIMSRVGSSTFSAHLFTRKSAKSNISIQRKDFLAQTEQFLTDSLLRHLVADVPVGLFLSGGVDSTLLLALAQKEGISIPSFSIVNSKEDVDFGTKDCLFAKKAAQQYGSQHHEYEIGTDMLSNFDDFVDQIDQPIGDSAELLTYLLAEKAQQKATVVLSGAGADEMFAGYHRHAAFQYYLNNKKTLTRLAALLKPIVNRIPSSTSLPLRKQIRLAQKFVNAIDSDPFKTFLQFADSSIINSVNAPEKLPNFEVDENDPLTLALNYDKSQYLISDILALNDRACMQSSVEMRMPYLDQELVNFVSNFPSEWLLTHGPKWVLREILKKYGGHAYVNRYKEGFGLPIGNWIRQGKVEYLLRFVENKNHFIFKFVDWADVKALLKAHKQGYQDHGPQLWSLIILAKWLEKEFAPEG